MTFVTPPVPALHGRRRELFTQPRELVMCPRWMHTPPLFFALIFVGACASHPATIASTPKPKDARTTIVDLFDQYDVVGVPEWHANKETHVFLHALVADPRLVDKGVTNIVVEFGNARLQDVADRYVRGEDVPEAELRTIWRDTTQLRVLNSPVYAEFFRAVREINVGRPATKQLRVLLADPPIDWTRVRTTQDYAPYLDRDPSMADVVDKQIFAQHKKGLFIAGGGHLLYAHGPVAPSAADYLRRRHAERVFMFWAVKQPLDAANVELPEARIARGTPLGMTKFAPYAMGIELVCKNGDGKPQIGPQCADREDSDPPTVADMTDGLLYYGPTPTIVAPDPAIYRDRAYADELRRRALITGRGDIVKDLDALPQK